LTPESDGEEKERFEIAFVAKSAMEPPFNSAGDVSVTPSISISLAEV
jgi:hypothetical protein